MKKVRIGAGSAGWPDMVEPALAVAERGNIDFQGFDVLGGRLEGNSLICGPVADNGRE